jgi:hypothetical protein
VTAGSSVPVSLSATGTNGFSSQISVQVNGLPSGVSASPGNVVLTPGNAQQVTLSAAANAAVSSSTVIFTGTSGALTHSTQLTLTVKAAPAPAPAALPSHTRYLRTDAAVPYFGYLNMHWIVYTPGLARYFVTDPWSNHVFVVDGTTFQKIATLDVPGAYGIDDTSDHSKIYVGTQIGDVYSIDPAALAVTQRYPAAQIGPNGFAAYSALVLADGRLALLGGQGGIPSVDGYTSFALWSPTDNSITAYTPAACVPMGNIGVFTRTPDRTKLVIASIDGDDTLCELDITTGTSIHTAGPGFIWRVTISPDGNLIILPTGPQYSGQAVVYDAHTLAQIAQFNVSGDTSSSSGFFVSADSKTLFTPSSTIVYAYDLSTGQQVGWLPNIDVPPLAGGGVVGPISGPNFQAVDNTGLLVGPMEEGIGFVDSAAMRTGALATQFTNGYLSPPSGPVTGGTPTKWTDPNALGTLEAVYFGANKASSVSAASGYINATSPPGLPGPVDIYAFTTDGGMQLIPEGFSYGPWVVQATPDMATAEGGGVGVLYGYGFGPIGPSTTIPSGLEISVGGNPATILAYGPNAYGTAAPPFPLQAVTYTVPPGNIGSADIQVTDSSGTTIVSGAMTYLSAIQRFPLSGSVLAQGIYDPYRNLYYFTDATKVQVFSRTQGQWLTPMSLPGAQRLWGIALSPDGSKLAVSDINAAVIYLIDPSNPASVKSFSVVTDPCGVAISDGGFVYYAGFVPDVYGYRSYFKLDTASGTITDYGIPGGDPATDRYLRTVISADNSHVYFNTDGAVFTINTATDTIQYAMDDQGCCYGDYDLALSGNQTRFEASSYLYDANLNAESYLGLSDREALNISYVYGIKLSPDGSLVFQPTTIGIDVLDGRIGTLRNRISLPVAMSSNYDALVADGKDNLLVAITGQGDGIAVIDLRSIAEPSPLPYTTMQASPRRLRGIGHSADRQKAIQKQRDTSAPTLRRTVPHVTTAKPGAMVPAFQLLK